MKFVPFPTKILITPSEQLDAFGNSTGLIEKGIVEEIGKEVKFLKKGDTVYFNSFGCDKTPEEDGKSFYVVEESSPFILGKISKNVRHNVST